MKPKMKILMSALSLVLVLTIGIIGVFALTQINIDAKLRVRFVAQKNVYASVSAKSYKSSQEAPVETLSPLVINGTEQDGYEGNLAFSNLIEVTQAETVDYVFEITNTTTVTTNPELVIEPLIEFADDFATWTIYYMADRDVGYKQLSNLDGTGDSYTYVELAKGESVRIRLSINSTDAEEDVVLDDSTMSFRLYTAPTAPTGYSDDAVAVTDSYLYYEVGDTVSLGMYPTTYVGDELNAELSAVGFDDIEADRFITFSDIEAEVFIYNGVPYARYHGDNSKYYKFESIGFTIVEVDDNSATLFANNVITFIFGNLYDDSCFSRIFDSVLSDMGIRDIALTTTVENIDFEGNSVESFTAKMWAPSSVEIEEWAEVFGDEIKIGVKTDWAAYFDNNGYYHLRDKINRGWSEDSLNTCSLKYVDSSGGIKVDIVREYYEGFDSYCILVRPVCRIAQLDYKGF